MAKNEGEEAVEASEEYAGINLHGSGVNEGTCINGGASEGIKEGTCISERTCGREYQRGRGRGHQRGHMH